MCAFSVTAAGQRSVKWVEQYQMVFHHVIIRHGCLQSGLERNQPQPHFYLQFCRFFLKLLVLLQSVPQKSKTIHLNTQGNNLMWMSKLNLIKKVFERQAVSPCQPIYCNSASPGSSTNEAGRKHSSAAWCTFPS